MLLKGQKEFSGFFHFLGYQGNSFFLKRIIWGRFQRKICEKADLAKLIAQHPVELAYCLALLNASDRYSITPPWVLKNYPATERIMFLLRSNPCLEGCAYCNSALDIHKGLLRFFGFHAYRTYGGEPLQEKAVQAAVANKSLLAVFPTGGGKSITFQVPALMSGVNTKGLTVVISPLQSLMKDQVDNLERAGIKLSPTQLKIINDQQSQFIVVAAGPGSGKTRVLVHKLASLLLMEDIKHEQLLMVTFSRAAATEFKKRLLKLIGSVANYVEIKTFHSYCFDLLGKVGTLEKSAEIIQETIKRIKNGEVEPGRITKTVLVIDEAQDMDIHEFALINALMEQNEEMRVIAVGDDDQNIYEFRGASSEHMVNLILEKQAKLYELVENYRSKSNLVDFSNQFVERIPQRLKDTPIIAHQSDQGKIKLVRYRSNHLITPLVQDVFTEGLTGTTCVLTKSNEEALQITGLLVKSGLRSKLIQSNDGFNLYNLLEVRFILSRLGLDKEIFTISDELWSAAKRELKERFSRSLNYEICLNLLKEFEAANPKLKYKSDLDIFIRESKLEDFLGGDSETIFVSTIHKAKGREFDNVFLMLDHFSLRTEESVRQLYVAITRAKRNLTIHYNGNYLDSITAVGLRQIENTEDHLPPGLLALQLTFKDVWLDFFRNPQNQQRVRQLNSGDELNFDGVGCNNSAGQLVLNFSLHKD
ncbi:MAG: UvrD-helicase domain-containing protein [Desulfitobacterium sp.]